MLMIYLFIISTMRKIHFLWNYFWWNRHVQLARMHDSRITKICANWRDNLE